MGPRDIEAMQRMVVPLLQKYCAISDHDVACYTHQGMIAGGTQAHDSWRALFAETMLRWNELKRDKL